MKKYTAYLDSNGCPWSAEDVQNLHDEYIKRGHTERDFERISDKFFACEVPTKEQCKEFLRDCRGVLYGDAKRENCGIFTEDYIVYRFHDNENARDLCHGCLFWQLTEKQGGGYVI